MLTAITNDRPDTACFRIKHDGSPLNLLTICGICRKRPVLSKAVLKVALISLIQISINFITFVQNIIDTNTFTARLFNDGVKIRRIFLTVGR